MGEFQAPWPIEEEDGLNIRWIFPDVDEEREIQRRLAVEADRSLDRFEAREARR